MVVFCRAEMCPVFTFTPATTFDLPLLFEQLIIFTCAGAVTTHDTFIHYQFAPKSQNFSQSFMTLLLLDVLGMPTPRPAAG